MPDEDFLDASAIVTLVAGGLGLLIGAFILVALLVGFGSLG